MARHLLHVFSTFGIGGPEVRTCDLINHFGDRYRHTIIAMDGNYDCRSKLETGAEVRFLEIANHRQNLWKNVGQFSLLLRQLKPDVLLTYNWGAIEWGLAGFLTRQCPHLHWEDGFGPEEIAGQKSRRIYARRIFLSGARQIIVPSKGLERIARQIWKFSASRVSYIPNGVDIQKYSLTDQLKPDLPSNSKPERNAGSLNVGTVATLRKEKNLPRLVRAFARALPLLNRQINAKLIVVGSGPEQNNLSLAIQQEAISEKVILLGHLNDPSDAVKSFDVFAISSDTEQMPLSVLEAMAARCPIVGTDVGDIREMIAPSNRDFLVAPTDEGGLADNIIQLLSDQNLRVRLGEDNFRRCQDLFDKNRMFQRYQNLFDGSD